MGTSARRAAAGGDGVSLSAARAACVGAIARGSVSFALAAGLLPRGQREDAAAVYAFCRRADDAVDHAPAGAERGAVAALRADLDRVYGDAPLADPALAAFRDVVRRRRIPRRYPEELVAGFDMDARGARYDTGRDVRVYAFRVAGAVGLMMCHVTGLKDDRALSAAARLGVAMQLTNICRDVAEDFRRGRLYLPADRLAARGAPDLRAALGGPVPARARPAIAAVVAEMLAEADRDYAAGEAGLPALPPRARAAVYAARLVYAEIGAELRRRGCDPVSGRVVVSGARKLSLAARGAVCAGPGARGRARIPRRELGMEDTLREQPGDEGAREPGMGPSTPRAPGPGRAAPRELGPDRKREVPEDFDAVADRYDLLQRLNPGYHKHLSWSARRMGLPPDARILDLCCGTGLSTEALSRAYPQARITGLDASARMLARAREKSALAPARFVLGDATDPAAAGAPGPFDGALVAYGLRNLPDPDACLRALTEVLAPGGVLAVHEYAVSDRLAFRLVWRAVAGGIILPLGAALGRSPRLFRYLRESVLAFDGVPELEERLRRAGFEDVVTLPMDGWQRGVVHTFLARRPR